MKKELFDNLVEEIKTEVFDFYGVEVEDDTVKEFIKYYYDDEEETDEGYYKPFTDEGIPVFDTAEREDFMIHLRLEDDEDFIMGLEE
jgi:hypothetical protein